MFDTIKLHIPFHMTDIELSRISWTKTNSTVNHDKNLVRSWFKHHNPGKNLPRMIYRFTDDPKQSTSLKIEVSIPKFLYGNNVEQFYQGDIERFFTELRTYVASALKLPIERIPILHHAETEKLHVCYNADVGTMKSFYLRAFSQITVPNYQCETFGNVTTVVWKAKTRKVKIYDKLNELKSSMTKQEHRLNKSLLQRTEGVLRFEIELSTKEIIQKSPSRSAIELLDFDWASASLHNWLRKIGISDVGVNPLEYYINLVDKDTRFTYENKKALIAYICRLAFYGKDWVSKHYATPTYKRNRNDIKLLFGVRDLAFSKLYLPSLSIDIENLKEKTLIIR